MRLIDADAFKDYIRNALEETKHMYKDNGEWAKEITESFCKDIDEQPTIQPEIVMCKDCKYSGTDATCCLVCNREGMGLRPFHVYHDDYCSYADKREVTE
jgi:hypothetical protein